jgi:hypothetical protein
LVQKIENKIIIGEQMEEKKDRKTLVLVDGRTVHALDEPIILQIKTKYPQKYMLVDLETGEQYIGSTDPEKNWKKLLNLSY